MKVFLLSAGYGKRLRPLTKNLPKCLVPINNVPLIEYWFRLFRKYQIYDVLINTHYLSGDIKGYISKSIKDINVKITYEPKLLGSLGSLIKNKHFISGESSFLVFYSDNITNLNIDDFISFHNSHDLPISIGLFNTQYPKQCGIVNLNEDSIVIDFQEKPPKPKGNLANAGVYIFDTRIINNRKFDDNKLLDISHNLLSEYTFQMKGYILDIGSINNYKIANEHVKVNSSLFE